MLGDMLAPCVPDCPSVFSPQTCPQVTVAFVANWPGKSGAGRVQGSRVLILPVLSMVLYKWDFGSHLFKGGDNELGGDEKNAKAGRFFRMSWGLRDVKDE